MNENQEIIFEEDEDVIVLKNQVNISSNINIEVNNELKVTNEINKRGSKQSLNRIKIDENDLKEKENVKPKLDLEEVKKFNEKKRKIEENLIKYTLKYFQSANILDITFSIVTHKYLIQRRLYIPDYIDLNLFCHIINEIFDWEGRSWQIFIKQYNLCSAPDIKEVKFETQNTKKFYNILDVKLSNLKFVRDEKFIFVYDCFGERWTVNCKIESIFSVKEIISRKYNSEKDRSFAFTKIKSLFRPILIKGEGIFPPEDIGGEKDFELLLKNKDDLTHPVVIKYISYYKSLIGEDLPETELNDFKDEEESNITLSSHHFTNKLDSIQRESFLFENVYNDEFNKRDIIDEYMNSDFDYVELQKSLGLIEFTKFYDKDLTNQTKVTEKNLSQITDIQSLPAYEYEYEFDDDEEEEIEESIEHQENKHTNTNTDLKSIRERETERADIVSKYDNYVKIEKHIVNNNEINQNNNRIDTSNSRKSNSNNNQLQNNNLEVDNKLKSDNINNLNRVESSKKQNNNQIIVLETNESQKLAKSSLEINKASIKLDTSESKKGKSNK